ncbi:SGNH/GDSL hydrolase family protein [Paenibacillus arenilitoris]|uniref:SGNH hydrolase-type esterase domain-containing protein n=1 Tax=Paenibacillus arenilitoris TaxID=2772299 RepID=A0A927H540_9BACL|nr:SGNH/GDSL hydrolase family protein [Paenibacillus arenilitoris]MBD2867154.1 hypothetical protein [Paenibacillus arenilitoris]
MTIRQEEERFTDFIVRGALARCARKLAEGKEATVAFIGGSVTVGAGATDANAASYRALACRFLERRYPHIAFTFVNAAIGGTDSAYGAFRLKEHAFGQGPADLLFVEFAVNDAGGRTRSLRAMEGIVRQAKRINPEIDLCFVYLANRPGAERYAATGEPQASVAHHEEVAEHYGIPSVHIGERIYRLLQAGGLRWEELSGDNVHPNDLGHSLYAGYLRQALEELLVLDLQDGIGSSGVPAPLDPYSYEHAGMKAPEHAVDRASGWKDVRGWTTERTCSWTPPADIYLGERPGDEFLLRFDGTAAGISLLAGPDTGDLEAAVDRGPYRTVPLFDSFCERFYRPKIALLADGLEPGSHTVHIRIAAGKDERSAGHAVRILKLLVNGR